MLYIPAVRQKAVAHQPLFGITECLKNCGITSQTELLPLAYPIQACQPLRAILSIRHMALTLNSARCFSIRHTSFLSLREVCRGLVPFCQLAFEAGYCRLLLRGCGLMLLLFAAAVVELGLIKAEFAGGCGDADTLSEFHGFIAEFRRVLPARLFCG